MGADGKKTKTIEHFVHVFEHQDIFEQRKRAQAFPNCNGTWSPAQLMTIGSTIVLDIIAA